MRKKSHGHDQKVKWKDLMDLINNLYQHWYRFIIANGPTRKKVRKMA
jgi:hypothetical protein